MPFLPRRDSARYDTPHIHAWALPCLKLYDVKVLMLFHRPSLRMFQHPIFHPFPKRHLLVDRRQVRVNALQCIILCQLDDCGVVGFQRMDEGDSGSLECVHGVDVGV